MKSDTETIGTIILDGIKLTHRRFYESGYPTAATAGKRDETTYSIMRTAENPSWSLYRLEGGWRLVRGLTEHEITEYEAMRGSARDTRTRQATGAPDNDDLTAETETGRISGAMPSDL